MTFRVRDISIAFRLAVLMFSMAVGVLVLLACARMAEAATLKAEVELKGRMLTAGDLFEGLDPATAARALGPAPQPGQEMTLNAITLMRVAAALDIQWKPQSAADQVVVRGAATVVGEEPIRAALMKALKDKGVSGDYTLTFFNQPKLVLPADTAPAAEVASLAFHAESDRFEATLTGPGASQAVGGAQVSGRIERTIPVPVLTSAIRSGDVIEASAIDWIDMPERSVQPGTILKAEDLAGKTPRRMIMAGKPVKANDIAEPQMIARGDSVTLIYEKGPVLVTARGRAMENGSRGAAIRVVNVVSNRPVDGTVTDTGTVTVTE